MQEVTPVPTPAQEVRSIGGSVIAALGRVEIGIKRKDERWVLDDKIDVSRTFDNI